MTGLARQPQAVTPGVRWGSFVVLSDTLVAIPALPLLCLVGSVTIWVFLQEVLYYRRVLGRHSARSDLWLEWL